MPYVLPEPVLAVEVTPYPAFDIILGRRILMPGEFTLRSNGNFTFQPTDG